METVLNLFDDLYSQYANKLQKYAERILHNPETAEDVVQDTFIVLLADIETVRSYKNPIGFVLVTLRNQIGNELQRQARRDEIPLEKIKEFGVEDKLSAPLLELLPESLSQKDREILSMYYEECLSYEEISHRIGRSVLAARTRLCRAKEHLRKILIEEKNL